MTKQQEKVASKILPVLEKFSFDEVSDAMVIVVKYFGIRREKELSALSQPIE